MKNNKLIKRFTVAVAIFASISSLCACSSNGTQAYSYDGGDYYYASDAKYQAAGAPAIATEPNYAYEESADYEYYDEGGGYGVENLSAPISENQATASVAQNRKLIKTVDMSIETVNFDETIANLKARIESYGGYIENEYSFNGSLYNNNRQSKYANITVRVPENTLDAFVNDVSGVGNVTQKTTSTSDVTLNYVDTESKKQMYLAQQESLLELLENAENIEDIAYLTEQLTEVRYNIESMESTLRVYDDLVDFSTVNFNINEVQVLTPAVIEEKTPGQELKEGFKTSVSDVLVGTRNFFIKLIIDLPYIIRGLICLAIPALIIFVVVKIVIASVKKKRKKEYEKYAAEKADDKKEKTPENGSAENKQ